MVVLRVILEMIGETIDARGQERDLHFGRPGVSARALVIRDDLRLFANRYSHAILVGNLSMPIAAGKGNDYSGKRA